MKAIIKNGNDLRAFYGVSPQFPYTLEAKPYKHNRSLEQNNLMWKWFAEIRDHLREHHDLHYTNDDIHDYYVDEYLPKQVKQIGKKIIEKLAETKKLNTEEMSEFLTNVQMDAAKRLHLQLTSNEEMML